MQATRLKHAIICSPIFIKHFEIPELPNVIYIFLIALFIPITGDIIKQELLLFSMETISPPNKLY